MHFQLSLCSPIDLNFPSETANSDIPSSACSLRMETSDRNKTFHGVRSDSHKSSLSARQGPADPHSQPGD